MPRGEREKISGYWAGRSREDEQKPQAARIYSHLRDTRNDPKERHVRAAAEKALSARPR